MKSVDPIAVELSALVAVHSAPLFAPSRLSLRSTQLLAISVLNWFELHHSLLGSSRPFHLVSNLRLKDQRFGCPGFA